MPATIRIQNREGLQVDLLELPDGPQDPGELAGHLARAMQKAYEQGRADEEMAIQTSMRELLGSLRRRRRDCRHSR